MDERRKREISKEYKMVQAGDILYIQAVEESEFSRIWQNYLYPGLLMFCGKTRSCSPHMCHPTRAYRMHLAFLRESGGHYNLMSLLLTQWRKKVEMCPSEPTHKT